MSNHSTVCIVTGEKEEGKTTFLSKCVDLLIEEKISTGGFLAHGIQEENERTGYALTNISTNETLVLSSIKPRKTWKQFGRFYFNPEALVLGNSILLGDAILNKKIVIIDEIGPFELMGEMWSDGLSGILENFKGILILSVRRAMVMKVIFHWNLTNPLITDISGDNPSELVNYINERLVGKPVAG